MRIGQLMTKPPKTCRPYDTLRKAAQMMWDNDCGCLPVTRGDGFPDLVGIVTDRDICMAARLQVKALDQIRVADAMTKAVCVCNPEDDLSEAEAIMQEVRVRRLPVIGKSGQIVGILSLTDIVCEAVRQRGWKHQEITHGEVMEVLATICDPNNRYRAGMADLDRRAAP